jgi:ArsR family transcriptional regulator, nickel/cobalt-responsive transcriptional repressor
MSHFRDSSPDARLLEPCDVLGGEIVGVDERIASLMGALASPTRIRVLFALLEAEELSTGELAKAVGMSASATSHQLRVLRDLGLIARRRQGRQCFYSLADNHLGVLLKESLYHVDHARLQRGDSSEKAAHPTPESGHVGEA